MKAFPQQAENLIIITTDGFRWQEVFTGMDSALANDKRYHQNASEELFDKYWSDNLKERRKLLMPFMWTTFSQLGSLYGNRGYDNKVNNNNPYWFSYPGYNELLSGYADTAINSNNYKHNPNVTLPEFLHKQPGFNGKVAAFGAWNAFDRILNEPRAGFPVICGFDTVASTTTEQLLTNKMLRQGYRPWGEEECLDVFTHQSAIQYLKEKSPKVLYIAYGETDEHAHGGDYRDYLNAAHQVDAWIGEIWHYVQEHPQYRNKTVMLVTVDHGRGDEVKKEWTSHNSSIKGSDQTWFALIGPGVPGKGELRTSGQIYQDQLAKTLARLLGFEFVADHPVGKPVKFN